MVKHSPPGPVKFTRQQTDLINKLAKQNPIVNIPKEVKDMKHNYFASSDGVPTSVLIADATEDAQQEHGGEWVLESVDEFHSEVTDDKGNVVGTEAKVVVRKV